MLQPLATQRIADTRREVRLADAKAAKAAKAGAFSGKCMSPSLIASCPSEPPPKAPKTAPVVAPSLSGSQEFADADAMRSRVPPPPAPPKQNVHVAKASSPVTGKGYGTPPAAVKSGSHVVPPPPPPSRSSGLHAYYEESGRRGYKTLTVEGAHALPKTVAHQADYKAKQARLLQTTEQKDKIKEDKKNLITPAFKKELLKREIKVEDQTSSSSSSVADVSLAERPEGVRDVAIVDSPAEPLDLLSPKSTVTPARIGGP